MSGGLWDECQVGYGMSVRWAQISNSQSYLVLDSVLFCLSGRVNFSGVCNIADCIDVILLAKWPFTLLHLYSLTHLKYLEVHSKFELLIRAG